MNPPSPPDPDAILASLRHEAARAHRGRLKVFFGMGPGVGKTFAMLRAAQQELRTGANVVVGLIESSQPAETAALLTGLPVIPRQRLTHRGAHSPAMDLEAILTRKPELVLVDEFAHANAPGSRHPKRYQDVIELLDAGINVFTTLNVQDLESRADAVRQISGASGGETVPDSVFELADQIELIDLPPESLLQRLREGKVHLGDHRASAANFFKYDRLTALRELALRFVAERVDKRLRELRGSGPVATIWRSGERLLVPVGPGPATPRLVRWACRLAAAQGASWIAVSVEPSHSLDAGGQLRLEQNLALARELGAEIVVTHDEDTADALMRVALRNHVTQIVVSQSHDPRWLDLLRGGGLVDRLLRRGGPVDIHVVPAERAVEKAGGWLGRQPAARSPAWEYGGALGTIVAVTLVSWFLVRVTGYQAIGQLYLLAGVVLSLRVGRGPMFAAAVGSALLWNFFFIPPRFTLGIARVEDGMMFGAYFVVALVAGQLTARIRAQERLERIREDRATALFNLTRALSAARTLDDGVFAALRQADLLFGAQTALLLGGEPGGPGVPHFASSLTLTEKEHDVAGWAMRNRRTAGRFTHTMPAVAGFHVPLVRENRALGVLVVVVPTRASLTLAQRDLIEGFAAQIALLVEREQLHAAVAREQLLIKSEHLHRVLLDSVSHELRTPLAVITSAVENLPGAGPAARTTLLAEIRAAARRLNRLVGHLLDQTRLESGTLRPRPGWCDLRDLINAAADDIRDALTEHPLEVDLPDGLPPVSADFTLTQQALANLLLNAALHTPAGTPILVTAGLEPERSRVFFRVADRGPGLPAAMQGRWFQKFQRGDAARAGGLGLGLAIVRGFIGAQGGEIVAGANPGGGAVFTIYLPHSPSQPEPSA